MHWTRYVDCCAKEVPLIPHLKHVLVQMPAEVVALIADSKSVDTHDEPCEKRATALDQVCRRLSEEIACLG